MAPALFCNINVKYHIIALTIFFLLLVSKALHFFVNVFCLCSLIQQILGMANPPPGPGGVYFPVQMLNIHGSPRDYAWGEGGLDAVITQLLNNAEGGHGPPPAPQAAISRLETIRISNIHIEQSQECPVCKEDFKNEESAKMLPCTHFFHPDCITTWLEMHNTCPVCRKAISDSTSSSHAR
ncbi:E3 ubiquitin-protein ligase RNF126-like isoform X2 [Diadema antillarum]|uniref:E3 ubiquitin-protein ligase RNF126-like isoform X2 n=1 Tax=Diadema antillarum TaxID=105358 RepID=UPI003A8C1469